MVLTFIVQNLMFGGFGDDNGVPEDRWPLTLKRLKSTPKPADFILFNEARDWEKQGHGPLARAMRDLDMDALPLAPSRSGQHGALLYRRETVGRWLHWNTGYHQEVTHGFGIAAFDVGLFAPLSVIPTHLTTYGTNKALQEIQLITSRASRYGPLAVIGGDMNCSPAKDEGPEPIYTEKKPWILSTRTLLGDQKSTEKPQTDRRVGQTLVRAGFVDVASEMYHRTGNDKYLQRTAYEDRIDQLWVTKPLASGILDYWLIDKPKGASDHAGLAFTLDTDLVEKSDGWQYH